MNTEPGRNCRVIEEASQWLTRLQAGETDHNEAFLDWIAQDVTHLGAVLELTHLTERLHRLTPADWARVLAAVRRREGEPPPNGGPSPNGSRATGSPRGCE